MMSVFFHVTTISSGIYHTVINVKSVTLSAYNAGRKKLFFILKIVKVKIYFLFNFKYICQIFTNKLVLIYIYYII